MKKKSKNKTETDGGRKRKCIQNVWERIYEWIENEMAHSHTQIVSKTRKIKHIAQTHSHTHLTDRDEYIHEKTQGQKER